MKGSFFKIYLNIINLTLALVAIPVANAQEVRVIDNKGTLETIRNNQVTTAAVAPLNPLEADVWYDTSGATTIKNTYDGTNWIPDCTNCTGNSVNVYTGFFIVSSTNPIATITGIPFQPSQVTFVAHANIESLDISSANSVATKARGINNSFGTMNGFARLNNDASITQQVIYVGGHGNSIDNISRFASSTNCLGLRFSNQSGASLGIIEGELTAFTPNGFTINVEYTNGVVSDGNANNPTNFVRPADVQDEDVVVLFTAYK